MDKAPNQRMQQLQQMLERTPDDAFLLYGIALEYKKMKEPEQAMKYLGRVIEIDPGYCYAYFQRGQIQESMGDIESAKSTYLAGIEAAGRKGDAHARSELEGALSMIE